MIRGVTGVVFGLLCTFAVGQGAEPGSASERLTRKINDRIRADLQAHKIVPAQVADDGEFLRRVYLDLIGRTPRVAETREFLADPSEDKRAKVVDKLLKSPAFSEHFAGLQRGDWLPQTLTDPRSSFFGTQFEDWLRGEIRANTPQDVLVKKLLTQKVALGQRGQIDPTDQNIAGIAAFFQANDVKPENLASTVTRVFLGVKLECAQCHDHPFAPYTRTQFWEFSAFFGEFTPLPPISPNFVGPLEPQYLVNRLTIPNTTREVVARHFDGRYPEWNQKITPREELANWLTAPSNPFFAKNIANRLWAHFFGIGLIDPIDEPGEANPPSHPELLEDLANALIEAKFDRQVLIKALVASEAYQRTSRQSHASQGDLRRFSKMAVRGLSALQIYDSFLSATGQRDDSDRRVVFFFDQRFNDGQGSFKQVFPLVATKPTEGQTSILQALMMMNGRAITQQTSVEKSLVLAAVIDSPFLDTPKKVETLFLATFSRKPTDEETERFTSYVERGGPSGNKDKALADVFWVLLNSPEFLMNR
jgi:hypothetical protein